MTLKSYYRDRQKPVLDAEELGLPIFVLRSNTNSQIEQVLIDLFNLSDVSGREVDLRSVNQQTQDAIDAVRNGQRWVDLPSASSKIRRLQHELVREANLTSHSYGREPNRYVRIFRE
jgi:predicted RNA-binding protein Jag